MRVLLTGSTGFIGRRLSKALTGAGHEVVSLVRGRARSLEGRAIYLQHFGGSELQAAMSTLKIDGVVNLAAAGVNPVDRDVNTLMGLNALFPAELALAAEKRGARAFIQIGSSAEYAEQPAISDLLETSPLESYKLYGATKASGSLLVQASGRHVGLPTAVLRLFNVFGPGEPGHRLFPSIVSQLTKGQAVPLSMGTQVRDFIAVDHVCDGILLALEQLYENPSLSGCYNLSSGQGTSVADFAKMTCAALNASVELLKFGAIPFRADDLPYVVGNPKAFSSTFGWSGTGPLDETVVAAVEEELRAQKAE